MLFRSSSDFWNNKNARFYSYKIAIQWDDISVKLRATVLKIGEKEETNK